jgi:hypothetical protein
MPNIIPARVARVLEQANQAAHGFAVGEAVAFSGNKFVKAKADSFAMLAWGVVSKVIDVDNFEFIRYGKMTWPAHGLTLNAYYYVSDVTPGLLTLVPPTEAGRFQQMMMTAITADTVSVFDYPAIEL